MFEKIRDALIKFFTSRLVIVAAVLICAGTGLVYRLFNLQIINGETYLDSFQLRIRKEKDIAAARGNIYDRNGNLLAYNELANSVMIEDVWETGSGRNAAINSTINTLLDILDKNGDSADSDFNIALDNDGNFEFTVSGNSLLRFLADVYGHSSINDLLYEEKTKNASEVIDDLCKTFGVGGYEEEDTEKENFIPGLGYDNKRILDIITVRYNMNTNSYQKYIDTTVSSNVSEKTVADVMENADILDGVSIEESTARKYVDSKYFSHLLGYTGKISDDELSTLSASGYDYSMNDVVGKSGIEQAMESVL